MVGTGAFGALCAAVADAHWVTASFVLAAPFLAVAGVVGLVIGLAWSRLRLIGVFGGALLVFWAVVQCWPTRPLETPRPPDEHSPCAAEAPPDRSIRVITWNTHGKKTREEARVLARSIEADVLMLQEVGSREFVEEIARQWNGEGVFSPTLWGFGLGVVVRDGELGRCFGEERKLIRELPATGRRRAAAMLAYARFDAGGTVPVVVLHNDRPADFSEVRTWPARLHGSARVIARMAGDRPAAIVAGDSNAPHEFRRFGGILAGAGLTRATPRRTWPVHIDGIPLVPVYALDGVWLGPYWQQRFATRPRVPLKSDHRMLKVAVAPVP